MADWIPNEPFLEALKRFSKVKAFVCYDPTGNVIARTMGISEEFENACNTIQSLGRNLGKTLGGDELEEIEFEFEVEGEGGASDRGLFIRYPRQRVEGQRGYLLVVVADGRLDPVRNELNRLERVHSIVQSTPESVVRSQPNEGGNELARGVDQEGKTPWDRMMEWIRREK
jgi:hypothetical protein